MAKSADPSGRPGVHDLPDLPPPPAFLLPRLAAYAAAFAALAVVAALVVPPLYPMPDLGADAANPRARQVVGFLEDMHGMAVRSVAASVDIAALFLAVAVHRWIGPRGGFHARPPWRETTVLISACAFLSLVSVLLLI